MRALLIDLSGLYWAAWHAVGNDGLEAPSRRVRERIAELAEGYERVILCLDHGSWRGEIFPAYKANRPPKPEAALLEFARVKADLARRYPCASAANYEADDIMATLARFAVNAGHEVTVASGDKDMLQLVGPGCRVLSTITGSLYETAVDVASKMGVRPEQVADFLALAGDSADGIPGVPGIGPKGASALLAYPRVSLTHLAMMLEDWNAGANPNALAPGVTQKTAEKLAAAWGDLQTYRKITALDYAAPIDCAGLLAAVIANEPPANDGDLEALLSESVARNEEKQTMTMQNDTEQPLPDPPEPEERPDTAPLAIREERGQIATVQAQAEAKGWAISEGPQTSTQAWNLARAVHASGLFRAFQRPESAFVAILAGADIGLTPMAALRGIHVIEGKPTISADMMASLILSSRRAKFFRCTESTAARAVYETHRDGDPSPVQHTFTADDAKAAELWGKAMWKKYPRNMLRARCASELARMVYPDLLAGVYTAEELQGGEA